MSTCKRCLSCCLLVLTKSLLFFLLFSQKASASFADPSRFRSFLVIDPSRPMSISSALRYWGCAIQAGTQISGAFGFAPPLSPTSLADVSGKISPLAFALVPYLSTESPVDWDSVLSTLSDEVKAILDSSQSGTQPLVSFDSARRTVTLFMPGFDKSEIKLYQVSYCLISLKKNFKKCKIIVWLALYQFQCDRVCVR